MSLYSNILHTLGNYHDKNVNYNTSVMTFWPQVYNKTAMKWQSTPDNLLQLFQMTDKFPAAGLEEVLRLMGLGDVATVIDHLLHEKLGTDLWYINSVCETIKNIVMHLHV